MPSHFQAQQQQLFETASFYTVTELSDEELMMLILNKSVPARARGKVQTLLKSLLDERRGLPGVLDIDLGELSVSYALDEQVAIQLKAIVEVARRLAQPTEKLYQIQNASDAAHLLQPELMHLKHEELHVLVLNTKNQVVHWNKSYKGTVNSSVLRVSEIIRPAIVRNAPRILIAHNHPSGEPVPSNEDIDATKQILQAVQFFDIDLLDHIVIGNPRYASLKEALPNLGW